MNNIIKPLFINIFIWASLAYGTYEELKTRTEAIPPITTENIENYPQFKDQFIQYALVHILDDTLQEALTKKYPEQAHKIITRQRNLKILAPHPEYFNEVVAGKWCEFRENNTKIVDTFEKLKAKMGLSPNILLFIDASNDGVSSCAHNCAIRVKQASSKYFEVRCGVVLLHPHRKMSFASLEQVIAHELAHFLEQLTVADVQWLNGPRNGDEVRLAWSREREYVADEIAALTLGSIDGAMEFFGATPDMTKPQGWNLPSEECFRTADGSFLELDECQRLHPSEGNRCRRLLALVEKYPEKFQKTIS